MPILSKADILGAADLPRELVEVPEWGGQVYVRALTGTERDTWEGEISVRKGSRVDLISDNMRAKLCAKAICDDTGARLFTDSEIAALGAKNASALARVFTVASRLSGLAPEDLAELEKK